MRRLGAAELLPRLETLERNLNRAINLLNGLLEGAQLASGRTELVLVSVDLVALVHEVVERSRDALAAAGSSLTVEAPPALCGSWDRLRLDQIVSNLVQNAIKYGLGSAITVRVRKEDESAILRVEDAGVGIAPADQARIFERFERAVPSRGYPGFGLGLWIVRQLVEAFGGTITVDSALGRGATFEVRLPLTGGAKIS
jgi:signal transduction histidine kinase